MNSICRSRSGAKAVTTFTIDVGSMVPTSKCFAEVRSLGVICRGESQAEVLGRLQRDTAHHVARMARRMVADMIETS